MSDLMIFDLDGTITTEMNFYSKIYSGTLEKLIENERGAYGLKILGHCRLNYGGQGELALFALGIPFEKWAQMLIGAPIDMIKKNIELVKNIRGIDAKKIIYTGSPREMALRIISKVGFVKSDFDLIIGWEKPEVFPLKWSCSPLIFLKIIQDMGGKFDEIWSIGDTWKTDLEPAKNVGAKTVMVRKRNGNPDFFFPVLIEFTKQFS